MATIASSECDLCEEIRLAGTAATGDARLEHSEGFSRLINRTPSADVIAALGAIRPGYLLVVPRRHVNSAGELSGDELAELFDAGWRMAEEVRKAFGGNAVLVEHGSSGRVDRGRACIVHCHVHVFPIPNESDSSAFLCPQSARLSGLGSLRDAAINERNYYLTAFSAERCYLATDPEIPSQYARRAWAAVLDQPHEWDWAAAPNLTNVRLTAETLRADQPRKKRLKPGAKSGSRLSETLRAYDAAADVYASWTRTFDPSTSLMAEILALTDQTDGLILDAGAGAGRDAAFMASLGRDVIALDASRRLLAASVPQAGVCRVVGDVRRIPLRSESVGAVWCSAVLLHMDRLDSEQALAEFWRVLHPGGLAQISVKEGKGHTAEPMTEASGSQLVRHFFYYEAADLASMASRSGFDVARIWLEDEADSAKVVQRWLKMLVRKPIK